MPNSNTPATDSKLLVIIPSLDYGGAEVHTTYQLNYLIQQGYNPHLAVLTQIKALQDLLQLPPQNIIEFGWQHSSVSTASVLRILGMVKQISNYLKQQQITHVMAHLPITHYLMRWVKLWHRLLKRPPFTLITYYHSLEYEHSPLNTFGKRIFNRFNAALAKLTDDVSVCVSKAVQQNVAANFFLRNPVVIYNALPYNPMSSQNANQYCASHNIPNANYTILVPGRLHPIKGHEFFVDVFAQVARQLQWKPNEVRVIIGGGGEHEPAIKQHINQKKLQPYFFFTGAIPQPLLLSFMNLANITIVPSLSEGMPIVAIEALMQQALILCSDAGGLPEVITDGVNGFVFPTLDANACAQKLIYLYQNQHNQLINPQTLLNDFNQRFSQSAHMKKLTQLLTYTGS